LLFEDSLINVRETSASRQRRMRERAPDRRYPMCEPDQLPLACEEGATGVLTNSVPKKALNYGALGVNRLSVKLAAVSGSCTELHRRLTPAA